MKKKQPPRKPRFSLTAEQIIAYAEKQRDLVGGGDRGLEAYWLTIITLVKLMK